MVTNEDYDQAYHSGYEKVQQELIAKLLPRGMCEVVPLRRSIVRYFVEREIMRKDVQKAVLDWIFNKRSSISLHTLESYVWLYDEHKLVQYQDEEQIVKLIAEMARKKVISGKERVHPWIG